MKKSDLKKYIKEEIISMLSEDASKELEATKELTQAVKDLGDAKKEAGLNEVDDDKRYYNDYDRMAGRIISTMMNMKKYVETNEPEALPLLDKALSAYEDFDGYMTYGSQNELSEIGMFMDPIGYEKSQPKENTFTKKFVGRHTYDILKNGKKLMTYFGSEGEANAYVNKRNRELNEEEDKEPSKAELKKTKGLAKAKDELVLLTREMKSLARKYKKAEGVEKDRLVDELKKKTKLKKELEAIVDKA